MKTNGVLKAARTILRADPGEIDTFRDAPVGNIVDALGRTAAMSADIKPVTRAHGFIGPVLTVDAGPRDNLAPWAALRLARPGDVMVIATGGHRDHSVSGDLLVGMAKNAGVVAVVTDGMVRDRSGLDAAGIPVFAAGLHPNSPQKNGPGSVGLPITCGGLAIEPGDIVAGDEDGVVIIPSARIVEAREALLVVRDKEAKTEAVVAAGATAPDWVSAATLDDLFTFVDA